MALENVDVIDVISIDLNGNVVLTISDDLLWEDHRHLLLLQNKLNAYLSTIETGSLFQVYPDAKGRQVIINIIAKYDPSANADFFLKQIEEILKSSGYGFSFRVLD